MHTTINIHSLQKLRRLLPHHGNLIDTRIETIATEALRSEKMPPPSEIALFAIIASNIHHFGPFRREGLQRNVPGNGGPSGRHTLGAIRRFLADRAPTVVIGEFLETVPVDGMPAGHLVAGGAG